MNVDERLEKLVERHEALTQSVEMLTADLRELKNSLSEVKDLVNDVAEGTARLLNVARVHEQRLDRLEGDRPTI